MRGRIPNHARFRWWIRARYGCCRDEVIKSIFHFICLFSKCLLLNKIWEMLFDTRLLHHGCLRINHTWFRSGKAYHARLRLKYERFWLGISISYGPSTLPGFSISRLLDLGLRCYHILLVLLDNFLLQILHIILSCELQFIEVLHLDSLFLIHILGLATSLLLSLLF